jgi:hypothetical protein
MEGPNRQDLGSPYSEVLIQESPKDMPTFHLLSPFTLSLPLSFESKLEERF